MKMKLLGIIGSGRKRGNSEVLAKEALLAAMEIQPSEVELIRLTNLTIKPCNGCMRCSEPVMKPCPVKDDAHWLFEKIAEADGIAIAAPTYFLVPSSPIALISSRAFMGRHLVERCRGKPVVTIVVSGRRVGEGLTAPLLSILPLVLGFEIYGSMSVAALGAAEILLNEESMEKARDLGRRLVTKEKMKPPPFRCPICWGHMVRLTRGGMMICPICYIPASVSVEDGKIALSFENTDLSKTHWNVSNWLEHDVEANITPAMTKYREAFKDIKAKLQRYDSLDQFWQKPPPKR